MATDEASKYGVPLADLEATAQVDPDQQIAEHDTTPPAPEDPSTGYLPGHVRPYGV